MEFNKFHCCNAQTDTDDGVPCITFYVVVIVGAGVTIWYTQMDCTLKCISVWSERDMSPI